MGLSDNRLREVSDHIVPLSRPSSVLVTDREAVALAREVLELREAVDDLQATLRAAWVDGYMNRSRPNPSRVTVAIAYDKVATEMPDAEMLRQLWGDPRVPAPRGALFAAPPALGGEG